MDVHVPEACTRVHESHHVGVNVQVRILSSSLESGDHCQPCFPSLGQNQHMGKTQCLGERHYPRCLLHRLPRLISSPPPPATSTCRGKRPREQSFLPSMGSGAEHGQAAGATTSL